MTVKFSMAGITKPPKDAQKGFQDVIGCVSFIISRVSNFSTLRRVVRNRVQQTGRCPVTFSCSDGKKCPKLEFIQKTYSFSMTGSTYGSVPFSASVTMGPTESCKMFFLLEVATLWKELVSQGSPNTPATGVANWPCGSDLP